MRKGHRDNEVIFNAKINMPITLTVQYTSANPEEQLCLYDVTCGVNDVNEFMGAKTSLEAYPYDYDASTYDHMFDTWMQYECGIGRGFDAPGADPKTALVLEMRCGQNAEWIYVRPAEVLDAVMVEDATMPKCVCNASITMRQT